MKQLNNFKHIHFVGIKGVGMAPLAIIAKEAGLRVSGADVDEVFITDEALEKAGIIVEKGFSKDHITDSIDLVITTGAHGGFLNPEVEKAKEKNIPIITQGQAVGLFMQGDIFQKVTTGISVLGTHGKTTTTGILATVFKEAGLDPSYIIGTSTVPSLPSSGHFGKGKYFIAEADEYATEPIFDKTPKFLWQHPKIAIITNIDHDHPDMYATLDDVYAAFNKFIGQLPKDGFLIVNGDDPQIQKLLQTYDGEYRTYGFGPNNMFIIKQVHISEDQMFFWIDANGESLGEFTLSVIGEHNALNAVAVIITALQAGISLETLKKALPKFSGSKRRAEFIGTLMSGAKLFDDYAHHPTEIQKTLLAFKKRFTKENIVCIFQPHTYSRTKALFDDFSHSFSNCTTIILANIYPSLREKPDETISSELLAQAIQKIHPNVVYIPTIQEIANYINDKQYGKDTIIITMGAGDIYKIKEKLEMR